MPKASSAGPGPRQDVKPVLGRFLGVRLPPSPRLPAGDRPVVKARGPTSACEPSGKVELRLADGSTQTLRIRGQHLDDLFKYMKNRHDIFLRRLGGEVLPSSAAGDDAPLRTLSLCNTFRLYDRNTQYLVRRVINPILGPRPARPSHKASRLVQLQDLFLRVALFRMWNRIDTWEELESTVDGPLVSTNVDFTALSNKLRSLVEDGQTIYSGAYQNNGVRNVPGRKIKKGVTPMYQCHLWLIEAMLDVVPRQLEDATAFDEVYQALIQWSGIGGFIGYQLALDLNMLPHLDFDIRFAQPGPGARSGLALLFGHVPPVHDTIALLVERQDLYWGRLGLGAPCMVNDDGKVVGKPGVSVVEVEHSLCELSKIERFRKGGHCKRDFVPNGSPVTATHPARFVVERES